MAPAFASVDDVIARLRAHAYVCDRRIATAVFLADRMEKPILVEGPAGVGKTELAKTLAEALSAELIRLQCYEGLDEAKALYEWEYPKQLLYTQILSDKIGEVTAGATSLADAVDKLAAQEDAFFSERFLLPRPLLRAIRSPQRSGPAHRRDRSLGRRVRGVPARGAVGLPGLGARARHAARGAAAVRAAHRRTTRAR